MTNTTEREQIVAWLREQAKAYWDEKDEKKDALALALLKAASEIERGHHLKESPHG